MEIPDGGFPVWLDEGSGVGAAQEGPPPGPWPRRQLTSTSLYAQSPGTWQRMVTAASAFLQGFKNAAEHSREGIEHVTSLTQRCEDGEDSELVSPKP